MEVSECDTPSLILDMEVAEANIKKMAEYVASKNVFLRPHVKVHKSPFLAHKQIAAGARGITCAKVSEAEVMAASGVDDILIANEVVGVIKVRRAVDLAKHCKLAVLVDDLENAKQISRMASEVDSNIGVLIELNLGAGSKEILDRCGVAPGQPALKLARELSSLPNVEFRGLMGYEGSLRKFADMESMKTGALPALSHLVETRDLIEDSGLNVETVSCGGTMSYNIASEVKGVTEIQAGSYIFMDTTYSKYGIDFDYALTILTGVISRPRPDKVITDAGLKAISADHGLPSVKGRPELECTALNAEHGHFRFTKQGDPLEAGDKVEVLPSRADTTTCLHDSYILARRGKVERSLEIACRGKLQ